MPAEIVQFVPRPRALRPSERLRMQMIRDARTKDILSQMLGVSVQYLEQRDPRDPNADTAPCECNPENLG